MRLEKQAHLEDLSCHVKELELTNTFTHSALSYRMPSSTFSV